MTDAEYCQPTMAGIYVWALAVFLAHYWTHYRDPWA